MRVAVIGHVEWVEFARVAHVPLAGEVVHAGETWEESAGGGAVVAVQLARLAGGASLYTALGEDELGRRARRRLEGLGVVVHAAPRRLPTRRALTFVDDAGERTIATLGERLAPRGDDDLPWELLEAADAVFFTAGDAGALAAARAARVVVATPRARTPNAAAVPLDALVYSAGDPVELAAAGALAPSAALVVVTQGARGGTWASAGGGQGAWAAAPLPGPVVDAYGCGDSFAAGLTYGLGAGAGIENALALAARCGATCLTGRGPYGRQLTLPADDDDPGVAPGSSDAARGG
ncbi:MAG: ribokinase [Solirubrobacteraceae bacterium]|jgi:ribokinase|nr:ribokinase [Solirubrobacteraceae bacterium]